MNNKRPLVPSFLQKLDDNLLRNKPTTWSARTHLVLYFAILFGALLTAFCFLVFFDAKQYSNLSGWITFVGLIAFIGFVFWLIYLLRFNVFKRYGNWFMWDGLKSFALYFISIGLMVAVCFIPSAVETFRANQQFGNDEIVNDINDINLTACKLEYNLLPHQWNPEKTKVVNEVTQDERAIVYSDDDSAAGKWVDTNRLYYRYIDTAELRTKLANMDSVVKLNDSMYIFYQCPDYRFINSYNTEYHSGKKIMRSADIYYAVIKNYQKPDRDALAKKMDAFKTKYAVTRSYYDYDPDPSYDENDSYDTKIKKKYALYRINNGIDNAVRKKYAWFDDWDVYLRIFYYLTLTLTMLVFIFRHSTVKTFFLSVLTAVILFIITGLAMVISYSSSETGVLSFMIIYYVVFLGISLSIFGSTVRKAIQGIGLNLCLFMTPFVPLIFVALNASMNRSSYYDNPVIDMGKPRVDHTQLYLMIAEIVGSLLLLILIEPFFRKLYRKWYAAAED